MSELFVDALRYPVRDRSRLDGTVKCLVSVLVAGVLVQVAGALWPDVTFLVPAALVLFPAVVFVALLAGVLAGEGFPSLRTRGSARRAGRLAGVTAAYLLPPAVVVAAVGFVTGTGVVPVAIEGVTAATLATVALLVTVVCAYLLPAAAVVAVEDGLRAGIRRTALRGTARGAYFLSWVGAAVLVVLAWSVVATTATRSVASLVGFGVFAYAHVAAAALVAEGVDRTTVW
ncbi:hypothetical protein GCM10008995_12250 [Halobellus salinus]|uniref:DUF4013 domain-containing protein n=1 Tax=Halobellus salinus TaxID=931585 RepID=A0A830EM08_9EURY|nr:hypothetical protein [Halobellus salinus]GGJ03971.1 hypothetical protein GCM10008995_12250 [Halobellus salinus]SMP08199.1 hypothetical protein SAMN06265347_1033 [Halobellus salinus]